jgi:hypothetical protein
MSGAADGCGPGLKLSGYGCEVGNEKCPAIAGHFVFSSEKRG